MQVLKEAYEGTGLGFEHAGTTRTVNATWFGEAEPGR